MLNWTPSRALLGVTAVTKVSRRLPSFSICNTKQNWLFDHVNVFYIPDSSVNVINWDSSNIHKCAKLTPQGFPLSFLIGLGKIRKGLAISLHAKGGDILHFLPSWSRWSNLSDYWPFLLDLLIFQWAIHPKHSQIHFLTGTLIYS